MSHELRTPLNASLGFSQLLERDAKAPLPPHQARWVAGTLQAGWHLLAMINDVLDLSRIDAGTLRLELETVPLAPLLQACVAMVESAAARRSIQLQVDPVDAALAVRADPTRLKHVLANLLSNAVKYNVEGGRITLRAHALDAATVRIEVDDTGLGLSPEQQRALFQPFNRLGREQSGIEGTGIGLVIVKRLVEQMGGTVALQSQPGAGSRFGLQLPRASAAPSPAPTKGNGAHASASAQAMQAAPARYRQRLLYCIEDNEANAEVMRGLLARRPQVRLQVFARGAQGLAAIRRDLPDLVLLDLQLPDLDGLEILRQLTQDAATAHIPVVVVSANATADRVDDAMQSGAAHYVTKPVNIERLLALLDRLLEGIDTRFGTLD